MITNKNVLLKTKMEMDDFVSRLRKSGKAITLAFSGNYDTKNKTESFSVSWTEDEENL